MVAPTSAASTLRQEDSHFAPSSLSQRLGEDPDGIQHHSATSNKSNDIHQLKSSNVTGMLDVGGCWVLLDEVGCRCLH